MIEFTTEGRATKHESLAPLLFAMSKEFREASRKKPDAFLNSQKVRIVNRLLGDVLAILEEEPSRAYLELLSDEELPQNSDVALMLGQAVAAMEAFKEKYFRYDNDEMQYRWMTKKQVR